MVFTCCNEERHSLVKQHPTLNGIDFVEVVDNPLDPPTERQTLLMLCFIKSLSEGDLTRENILISGGERITKITVQQVFKATISSPPIPVPQTPSNIDASKVLFVKVAFPGDFSTYSLNLINPLNRQVAPDGFDTVLSSIDFSFKVLCNNNFDCKPESTCSPEEEISSGINYLAKDYQTFRKLMLDRMSLLSPGWIEKNAADTGVTLVELLAYVADHLSYQQDAIATEAYIGTARRRVSVKRHARLVDYYMHNGSNARCWVQIKLESDSPPINLIPGEGSKTTKFVSKILDQPLVLDYSSENYEVISQNNVLVFEALHQKTLYSEHNTINFYTWGDKECCLPKGSTKASLMGNLTNLKVGDVLIFSEVRNPETGTTADANPTHKHPVRITAIAYTNDPLGSLISSEYAEGDSIPVTNIEWHDEDALPFALCISSLIEENYHDNISIALGNIILVDHGLTVEDSENQYSLEPSVVPESNPILTLKNNNSTAYCGETENENLQVRYYPKFPYGPVCHTIDYSAGKSKSAKSFMNWKVSDTKPEIKLMEEENKNTWMPKRDLLNSDYNSRHFVYEMENNGLAHIRFGDNNHGAKPLSQTIFKATYRIGNGRIGNIGAGMLYHIMSDDSIIKSNPEYISKVWNPMAASGGVEPETVEEVRQKVGKAFRKQERTVVASDYMELAQDANSTVQRVAVKSRWTGSWHTNFVTFDRYDGQKVDKDFIQEMNQKLEKYRIAGQDNKISAPEFVSLELEMRVCLEENYFISDVRKAILDVFNNGLMKNGQPALFHSDNFTFGQILYLSNYYAAAQSIPGVKTVRITKFQRQGINSTDGIDSGKISFGPLEIPRLDNNPNYRENGIFNLIFETI